MEYLTIMNPNNPNITGKQIHVTTHKRSHSLESRVTRETSPSRRTSSKDPSLQPKLTEKPQTKKVPVKQLNELLSTLDHQNQQIKTLKQGFKDDIQHINEQHKQEIQKLNDENNKLKNENQQLTNPLSLSEQIDSPEEESNVVQISNEKFEELKQMMFDMESKLKENDQTIKNLKIKNQELENRLLTKDNQLKDTQNFVEKQESVFHSQENQIDQLNKQVLQLEKQLKSKTPSHDISSYENKIKQQEKEISTLTNQNNKLSQENNQIQSKLKNLENDLLKLKQQSSSDIKKLKEENKELNQKNIQEKDHFQETLNKKIDEASELNKKINTEIKPVINKLTKENKEKDELIQELTIENQNLKSLPKKEKSRSESLSTLRFDTPVIEENYQIDENNRAHNLKNKILNSKNSFSNRLEALEELLKIADNLKTLNKDLTEIENILHDVIVHLEEGTHDKKDETDAYREFIQMLDTFDIFGGSNQKNLNQTNFLQFVKLGKKIKKSLQDKKEIIESQNKNAKFATTLNLKEQRLLDLLKNLEKLENLNTTEKSKEIFRKVQKLLPKVKEDWINTPSTSQKVLPGDKAENRELLNVIYKERDLWQEGKSSFTIETKVETKKEKSPELSRMYGNQILASVFKTVYDPQDFKSLQHSLEQQSQEKNQLIQNKNVVKHINIMFFPKSTGGFGQIQNIVKTTPSITEGGILIKIKNTNVFCHFNLNETPCIPQDVIDQLEENEEFGILQELDDIAISRHRSNLTSTTDEVVIGLINPIKISKTTYDSLSTGQSCDKTHNFNNCQLRIKFEGSTSHEGCFQLSVKGKNPIFVKFNLNQKPAISQQDLSKIAQIENWQDIEGLITKELNKLVIPRGQDKIVVDLINPTEIPKTVYDSLHTGKDCTTTHTSKSGEIRLKFGPPTGNVSGYMPTLFGGKNESKTEGWIRLEVKGHEPIFCKFNMNQTPPLSKEDIKRIHDISPSLVDELKQMHVKKGDNRFLIPKDYKI